MSLVGAKGRQQYRERPQTAMAAPGRRSVPRKARPRYGGGGGGGGGGLRISSRNSSVVSSSSLEISASTSRLAATIGPWVRQQYSSRLPDYNCRTPNPRI